MRGRRGATWRTIAEDVDIRICGSGPVGCRKKWSKTMHEHGRVDQIGVVHWDGWDRRASTKGLRKVLMWAAYAKHREWREQPKYLGIWNASRWAFHEAMDRYHLYLKYEETVRDRQRVKDEAHKAGVSLRYELNPVYRWANWRPERARGEDRRHTSRSRYSKMKRGGGLHG